MSEHTKWTAKAHPIQQAARGIVAHWEGEGWQWPKGEFIKRVDEVARLIAAAPELLAFCEGYRKCFADKPWPSPIIEWTQLDSIAKALIAKAKPTDRGEGR